MIERLPALTRLVLALFACMMTSAVTASEVDPTKLDAARRRYDEIVAAELARKIVPGVSVAWIVDGQLVHVVGYGQADFQRGVAAGPDTIYRAGSISKLFNAVAAMQLVEQGKFDLDAPIQRALPEFRIMVPFEPAIPITIRQLLCHRSGMIREAPLGGYLDNRQPSVADTIASVAQCVLVNPPNAKTRYSNVGPTIVGRALEVQTGMSFVDYQQRHVLDPLGMQSSAWTMNDTLRPRLAKGLMRVARGNGRYEFEPAEEFELGTMPAGNLYTSAADLARFASFVMGSSTASESTPTILSRSSLEKMFVPQLTNDSTGYGLGFSANRYREHKTVQHMGAVYGFTTSLVVLREERIGAIVLSNADIAVAPVKRLSDAALDLLLEAVRGESIPQPPLPADLPAEELAPLAGEYQSHGYWATLEVDGKTVRGNLSGQPIELTPVSATKFLADGRIMHRAPFEFDRSADGSVNSFTAAAQKFSRVEPAKIAPAPEVWQAFVGMYGPAFIPLVISIRHGHLHALVENEYEYRLTPVNRVTFRMPPGMYDEEHVVFQLDAHGQPIAAVLANMFLPRRAEHSSGGGQ